MPGNADENELIAPALAVARAALNRQPCPPLSSMQAPVLWQWLEEHALGPLCAPLLLEALAQDKNSEEIVRVIRAAFRENLARGLYLATAAQSVLGRLNAAGIAALTFKGPALALDAYGGIDRRGFDDVDVLVARKNVRAAVEALAAGGWAPRLNLQGWQLQAYIRDFAALELTRDGDGAQLDLHWTLTESWFPVRLPVKAMLARRRTLAAGADGAGGELMTLTPEDHFTVVAIHAAKHAWRDPRLVVDACAAARRVPSEAWPEIAAAARRRGYGRILWLNFELAWRLLDIDSLPAASVALKPFDDAEARAVVLDLKKRCLGLGEAERPGWKLLARLRERRRDGYYGAFCLATCLTPRDFELAHLPRALAWLYYPLRVGRLAARRFARVGNRETGPQ